MFDIGPEKLLVILVLALVFLGPKKLPEVARSLGKSLREFRRAQSEIREDLMGRLDEEVTLPPAPSGEKGIEQAAPAPTKGHNGEGGTG